MKNLIKKLFFFLLLGTSFVSCKKDENRITFEGGTNPVLSANKSGEVPLGFLTQNDEAITFSWTNPDYKFTTGVSSQDVNYLVEIDTVGANFTNPNKKSISISKELTLILTQSQLNDIVLNQLQLDIMNVHQLEARVKASLFNGNGALYSNTISFSCKAYSIPPKVNPPASGHLFMVGSATPGSWNNPVPIPSQEFTMVTPTLFELTLQLNGGGSYLFLPINGYWGAKYGGLGSNNTNNPDGDDFKPEGGDLIAPAASGLYKIVVDFQRGKFTLTRL